MMYKNIYPFCTGKMQQKQFGHCGLGVPTRENLSEESFILRIMENFLK